MCLQRHSWSPFPGLPVDRQTRLLDDGPRDAPALLTACLRTLKEWHDSLEASLGIRYLQSTSFTEPILSLEGWGLGEFKSLQDTGDLLETGGLSRKAFLVDLH